MKKFYLSPYVSLCLVLILLSSCASMRRFSEKNSDLSDFSLNNKINLALFSDNVEILGDICFHVFEGKVLLACSVSSEQQKQRAEDIVRAIKGVSKVYNHIHVKKDATPADTINDAYISTRLAWSLMIMGDILRDDYTYEVHRGIVYFLGKAPDDSLRRKVIDAARSINGVEKVVSYITLAT